MIQALYFRQTGGWIRYYSTEDEFRRVHAGLKNRQCPHCLKTGFLILHGYLYGYGDEDSIKRGHRIFCSNRNRRSGCGRTFCILKAWFIKNFMICAEKLSAFLDRIMQGDSPARAFTGMLHPSGAYRILKRFKHGQARIRTFLTRIKDPPCLSDIDDPVLLTIAHLKLVFKDDTVSQFQQYFQTSFL